MEYDREFQVSRDFFENVEGSLPALEFKCAVACADSDGKRVHAGSLQQKPLLRRAVYKRSPLR